MKSFGEDGKDSGKLEPKVDVVRALVSDLGKFLTAYGATAIEQINAQMLVLEASVVSLYKVYNMPGGGAELPIETIRALLADFIDRTIKTCCRAPGVSDEIIARAFAKMSEEAKDKKNTIN